MATDTGIAIRSLYKIFGSDPLAHIDAVKGGLSKADLLEQHSHVLGLKDININMAPGQIQVVMGLSGSGKSTLIRHINRLIDPTVGEVIVVVGTIATMATPVTTSPATNAPRRRPADRVRRARPRSSHA